MAPAAGPGVGCVAVHPCPADGVVALAVSKTLRLTEVEFAELMVARGQAAQAAAQDVIRRATGDDRFAGPTDRTGERAARSAPPAQRKPRNTGTALMDMIRRAIQIHPAVAWVVRFNSGQFKVGGGSPDEPAARIVRAAFVGCPDLWGQMKTGELLVIEAKAPGKNPTSDQQAVIDKVQKYHGCAGCAHSVAEAIEIIEAWRYRRRVRARR